jgi:hypothetical protein
LEESKRSSDKKWWLNNLYFAPKSNKFRKWELKTGAWKTHNSKQEMIQTYYSEWSEEIKKKINAGNQKSK